MSKHAKILIDKVTNDLRSAIAVCPIPEIFINAQECNQCNFHFNVSKVPTKLKIVITVYFKIRIGN